MPLPIDGAAATTASAVELSVVVPACDEAATVLPLLGEIRSALAGTVAYEVVVVDDASTDGTIRETRIAMAKDPRVRLLHHRQRAGQSAAITTGVLAARAPWIATLDADGQNDPADLPRLLEQAWATDCFPTPVVVVGERRRRRPGLARRIVSRVANAIRRRLLHDGVSDSGCGLKVFPRDAYLALPRFDHMHRFLPALFRAGGAVVQVMEVHHRPRRGGRSKYRTLDRLAQGIVDLLGVLWLVRRSIRPAADELS